MSAPTEYFDFDPALVDFIAAGLQNLPYPDGTPLVFPAHADTFPGDTEEEQKAKTGMNRAIAVAMLNYYRQGQHTLVADAVLAQPQQFGESTIVTAHCATCAGVLFAATMSRDGKFTVPPRSIDPDCETRHGAA